MMGERILILGSGERALSWKLPKSLLVDHICVLPSNGETAANHKPTNLNSPSSPTYCQDLVDFAVQNQISLVMLDPEEHPVTGIKEHFQKVGISVFDPSEPAVGIETHAASILLVNNTPKPLSYADAGVSVGAGNSLVNKIKRLVRLTKRSGSDAEIGGFGGTFDLKAIEYQDPVLVSGTDGVGTKLLVAIEAGVYNTVGIDLVAMSVNDLLVRGAEPLFFLDYYACNKLHVDTATDVIAGMVNGCREAGCALIGGETAEMPGIYRNGDYDLAGFAVGAVERHLILPRQDIVPGDVLFGIASSGLHSNGLSLVRKIISLSGLTYSSPCPWDERETLSSTLLQPTRIYVKQVLPTAQAGLLKGMAHITGGGFIENIPRILPKGLGCYIDVSTWTMPPVFRFLMTHGGIEPLEMAYTFNNAIGLVLVVDKEHIEQTLQTLQQNGNVPVYVIGEVTEKSGVDMRNLECCTL